MPSAAATNKASAGFKTAAPQSASPRLAGVVVSATAVSRIAAAGERGDWAAVLAEVAASPADVAVQEAAATAFIDGCANKEAEKRAASEAGAVATFTKSLREHLGNESVCMHAAWALTNVSISGDEEIAARFSDAGTLAALLAACKRHSKAATLVQFAWRAMNRIVCDNPAMKLRAGDAGAIEAAVAALKEHRASAETVESVLETMAPLVREEANASRALRGGAFDSIVAVMRAQSEEGTVQASASALLLRLLKASDDLGPRMRSTAAQKGVIEALVAALKTHASDVAVQETCCWALSSAISNSPENKRQAHKAGAVPAVLAALRTHGHDDDVQENALMVLSAISSEACAAEQIIAVNGAATVVAALQLNSGNRIVQHTGCECLVRVAIDKKAAKLACGEAGAMEAALDALRAFADSDDEDLNASVAESAVQLVAVLATEPENAARCVAAHGLETLVTMIQQGNGDASTMLFTLKAINRAVLDNPEAKARAGECDAVEAIVHFLGALAEVVVSEVELLKEIQPSLALGMQALCTLVSEDPNAMQAVQAGAFEVMAAVMKLCIADEAAQQAGCTAVIRIVGASRALAEDAVDAGLVTSVLDAMRKHPREAMLQGRGAWALIKMVANYPVGRTTPAVAGGGVELCLAALRTHPRDCDLCENALGAISAMFAEDCDTVQALIEKQKDALPLTVAAMKAHSSTALVQRFGASVLASAVANKPAAKVAAAKAGALDVLVAALKAHVRQEDAMTTVTKACGNLLGEAANVSAGVRAGAVEPLVACMRAHPALEAVQEDACKSLALLCDNGDGVKQAVRAGAAAAVRDAAARFKPPSDVASWATRALAKLS